MALNLKTLATRSISAIVFVVLLLGCVYWNYLSFSLFFFVVSLIGLYEFYKIAEKMGAKPIKVIGFIIAPLLFITYIPHEVFFRAIKASQSFDSPVQSVVHFKNYILEPILLSPFILLAIAMFSKNENSIKNVMFTIGGIIYAVFPFAILEQVVFSYSNVSANLVFEPMNILGVIFLIWSNDTLAYLGGSLFGKNKMIERVSPGKTWEGTIIGVLMTFGLCFLFNYIFKIEGYTWPILGIIVPILATIGDLVESKLKREAGVKDSGSIMPGHGGVLDRFDSLIFVSPFIYVFFKH